MKKAKSKKKMPKEISASLITLTVILITLGVTLPLHFIYPDKLTVYWVIAICVAVISPYALANFKIYAEARGNYTEEQKKVASGKIGLAMLSVWYVDFTFICMFMNWLVAFFILAGLYLIKMIYNVASVLVNRKDATTYPNFLIIGDFVLSFLLLALLIYKIPNQMLQTIVTSLVASLIGGLLTLLGVMLTIKKSDKDRKEEEIARNKPFLFIVNYKQNPIDNFLTIKINELTYNNKSFCKGKEYILKNFYLKNADYSYSCIKGICINDDILMMKIAQAFEKRQTYYCKCNIFFNYEKKIENMYLLLVDMLNNYYALEVNYQIIKEDENRWNIEIISGIEFFKVKINWDNLSIIKEAK